MILFKQMEGNKLDNASITSSILEVDSEETVYAKKDMKINKIEENLELKN